MGPGDLYNALCGLTVVADPKVMRGMASLDDAGVYRLSDELALIQTIDFFTPIVDDPYRFGQIAAANALSDVYSMGGRPLTAMNIVCFPVKRLDISVLKDILRGGLDKMNEAGVALVGGHSVEDAELKYGLSVTGTVHPDRLVTNGGARPGDRLILTKPLGTGIIGSALKAGQVSPETESKVAGSMAALNRTAAELMQAVGVHACTDITGFGLAGHIIQMAENSRVGIELHPADIPYFPEVVDFSRQGLRPGGLSRNRDYYADRVKFARRLPDYLDDILFDPQTSGGLLIALDEAKAARLLGELQQAGVVEAAIIGEVVRGPVGVVNITL